VGAYTRWLVRIALVCGMVSSLLYASADVLAAMRYADYHSFTSQTISELTAIGAPSRRLVLPLLIAHSFLALAFGVGVWRSAGPNSRPRIAAQEPTPWIGVAERINIGGYLPWQRVLALSLLRVQGAAPNNAAWRRAA
jgi:hypothetical protein